MPGIGELLLIVLPLGLLYGVYRLGYRLGRAEGRIEGLAAARALDADAPGKIRGVAR